RFRHHPYLHSFPTRRSSDLITTLVDMPLNSSPVTTSPEALGEKLSAAGGKLSVDCGFYGGLIPENSDRLQPLIDEGVLGIKEFLDRKSTRLNSSHVSISYAV